MNKLDRLLTMSDKQIQDWLRSVSSGSDINTLPIALSGVNDDIRECVYRNMSVHARSLIDKSVQEQRNKKVKKSELQKCINVLADLL